MGANFSRIKTWISTEDVTASDLNAEFDNILNNLTAANVDDSSANVTAMQATVDPGEVGTESLATSVEGEIQRIRFMLNEIIGKNEWYESPISSLEALNNAIGSSQTNNRLVSGATRSGSAQPIFLVADGTAATVKVDGSSASFVYFIEGTQYTISTEVSLASLTTAPASNNTCLIDDADASDQDWTKHAGEDGTTIPVDNMGAEISSLVGQYAAFSLAGTATEYFTAYVKSTTELTDARRGYFFDSAKLPVERAAYTNNDTITLLKITYVFAKTDGTLTATFNNPTYSKDEPTSPAVGDYWFDIANNKWKVRSVGVWNDADATLIGVCAQDASATVCARSFEFFKNYEDVNTYELILRSVTEVAQRNIGSKANVFGETVGSDQNARVWDITVHRDSGVSESASTWYYFYLTEQGDVIISDIKPHDRREDLGGWYHTHQSWRCLGFAYNNSGSDLSDVVSFYRAKDHALSIVEIPGVTEISPLVDVVTLSGSSHSPLLPSAKDNDGKIIELIHAGTSLTQVYTLTPFGSETIRDGSAFYFHTKDQAAKLFAKDGNWRVLYHQAITPWVNDGSTVITATTANPAKGTVSLDQHYWMRNGKFVEGRMDLSYGSAGTAGTGDYRWALPSDISADTAVTGTANWTPWGSGYMRTAEGDSFAGIEVDLYPYVATATTLGLVIAGVSGGNRTDDMNLNSSTYYPFSTANQSFSFYYRVPVENWEE